MSTGLKWGSCSAETAIVEARTGLSRRQNHHFGLHPPIHPPQLNSPAASPLSRVYQLAAGQAKKQVF